MFIRLILPLKTGMRPTEKINVFNRLRLITWQQSRVYLSFQRSIDHFPSPHSQGKKNFKNTTQEFPTGVVSTWWIWWISRCAVLGWWVELAKSVGDGREHTLDPSWTLVHRRTHTHTPIPRGNSQFMFLDCGGKLDYVEETHADAGRRGDDRYFIYLTEKFTTPNIKGQSSELNPEPSLFFFSCYGTVTCWRGCSCSCMCFWKETTSGCGLRKPQRPKRHSLSSN